ncbi:hypothetical protein [Bosea sp. (in: a-proteobacteria)]|uniref:hypothetical protein n=1 Tax=Bosea sp. (in: a-proteobacteria) TaxID=1871050 RepID=UPI002B4A21A1|nr:hypothetical protein [Bosea sp. (in: a-proteobacteria)]WRH58486.1 MAG: hypothetical protein RSE11_01460 [Bosea sp. (in: a-proteobacteria)]
MSDLVDKPKPFSMAWWRAIFDEHSRLAIGTAAVALIGLGLTASWSWLTGGGLIKAIGGETALPLDTIIAIREKDCPGPRWRVVEAAKGRTLLGSGKGANTKDRQSGDQGGREEHTLTVAELPPHSHAGVSDTAELMSPLTVTFAQFTGNVTVGGPVSGAFGGGTRQAATAFPSTIPFVQHRHRFITDGGTGLLGQPTSDNNMPPWFGVTFCERVPS